VNQLAEGKIIERQNKDGSTSYQVVVPYKDNNTGKWRYLWRTTRGKRQAQTLRTKLLSEVSKGDYTQPSKLTVAAHMADWLNGSVKSTVSPRTAKMYSDITRLHIVPVIGTVKLSRLKPQTVQALYSAKLEQGLSPRSVQLIHTTLHKSLSNAVRLGLISHNPLEAVDIPKVERHEMKTMTEENIKMFLDEARKRNGGEYYGVFFCLLFTGLRRNEALALRWTDIDLLGAQLSVNRTMQFINNQISFKPPKTKSSRRQIALTPATCVMLRLHREAQDAIRDELDLKPTKDSDLIFCQHDGKPYSPDVVTRNWIKLVRRCGLDGINLHAARHTHASILLKQGVSLKVISERLGHASIGITADIYSHITPGMQKAAAASFDDAVVGISKNISLEIH